MDRKVSNGERKDTNWDKYLGSSIFPRGVFQGYKKFVHQIKKDWPKNGARILELGSGSGKISFWLSKKLPISEIVLVDFNERLLKNSRKFFSDKNIRVRFIKEDIRVLDLKEKFDLVHSAGVLEHFLPKDQKKIIEVHKRHLKKNGWVISYTPTPEPFYRFWRNLQESISMWRFPDEVPLKKSELSNIFINQGFEVLADNTVWRWYLSEVGVLAKLI